jgi:membrane-associated HD superfamily phosphohydrolase
LNVFGLNFKLNKLNFFNLLLLIFCAEGSKVLSMNDRNKETSLSLCVSNFPFLSICLFKHLELGVCACPSIKLQLPPSYLSTLHTLSMLSSLSLTSRPQPFLSFIYLYINTNHTLLQQHHNKTQSSFSQYLQLLGTKSNGTFFWHNKSHCLCHGCFWPIGF